MPRRVAVIFFLFSCSHDVLPRTLLVDLLFFRLVAPHGACCGCVFRFFASLRRTVAALVCAPQAGWP